MFGIEAAPEENVQPARPVSPQEGGSEKGGSQVWNRAIFERDESIRLRERKQQLDEIAK